MATLVADSVKGESEEWWGIGDQVAAYVRWESVQDTDDATLAELLQRKLKLSCQEGLDSGHDSDSGEAAFSSELLANQEIELLRELTSLLQRHSRCFDPLASSQELQKTETALTTLRRLDHEGRLTHVAHTLSLQEVQCSSDTAAFLTELTAPERRFALIQLFCRKCRLHLLRNACDAAEKTSSIHLPWLLRNYALCLTRSQWSKGVKVAHRAREKYSEYVQQKRMPGGDDDAFEVAVITTSPKALEYRERLERLAQQLLKKTRYALAIEAYAMHALCCYMVSRNPVDSEDCWKMLSAALRTINHAVAIAHEHLGSTNPLRNYIGNVRCTMQGNWGPLASAHASFRSMIFRQESRLFKQKDALRKKEDPGIEHSAGDSKRERLLSS